MFTSDNARFVAVAAVCLALGAGTPAAVGALTNADKVDGFHAVGAGASADQRKGKLVATSKSNGKLPNNIIATAPNAAKLGGVSAADLRYLDIPVTAGQYDDEFEGLGDVRFPTPTGSWATSFRIPPDHPATAPVTLELDYSLDFTNCAWQVQTLGAISTVGGDTVGRDWIVSDNETSAAITVPATTASVFRHTFALNGTVPAGTTVKFALSRFDVPADTCGEVILRSVLVRY